MHRTCTAALVLSVLATASYASGPVEISDGLSATCQDAALITFWESTAHLSATDKKKAEAATLEAKAPNRVRPVVPSQLIEAAQMVGRTSHGNAGKGNTDLESAREDAIAAALQSYGLCIEGQLKCEHCGESDRWWEQ